MSSIVKSRRTTELKSLKKEHNATLTDSAVRMSVYSMVVCSLRARDEQSLNLEVVLIFDINKSLRRGQNEYAHIFMDDRQTN